MLQKLHQWYSKEESCPLCSDQLPECTDTGMQWSSLHKTGWSPAGLTTAKSCNFSVRLPPLYHVYAGIQAAFEKKSKQVLRARCQVQRDRRVHYNLPCGGGLLKLCQYFNDKAALRCGQKRELQRETKLLFGEAEKGFSDWLRRDKKWRSRQLDGSAARIGREMSQPPLCVQELKRASGGPPADNTHLYPRCSRRRVKHLAEQKQHHTCKVNLKW